MKLLTELNYENYQKLVKIISTFERGSLFINENIIYNTIDSKGATKIKVDISNLLEVGLTENSDNPNELSLDSEPKLTLHIANLELSNKVLKSINKTKNNIQLYDDAVNSRYCLNSGKTKLYFPKVSEKYIPTTDDYLFDDYENVGKAIELHKEDIDQISKLLSSTEDVELLIKDDQFYGIYIKDKGCYIFDEHSEYTENDSDERLTSNNFIPIKGISYKYQIVSKEDDVSDISYVLLTHITDDKLEIYASEPTNQSTNSSYIGM